jgi:hypothetical protein
MWRTRSKLLPLTLTLSPYARRALEGEGMAACPNAKPDSAGSELK